MTENNVVNFPRRCDPVITDALVRINLLIASYLEPGPRPAAHDVLMRIGDIMEEPKLCEAAGITRPEAE